MATKNIIFQRALAEGLAILALFFKQSINKILALLAWIPNATNGIYLD